MPVPRLTSIPLEQKQRPYTAGPAHGKATCTINTSALHLPEPGRVRVAVESSKSFASCDEIFGPSRPQQATHGWTLGIAPMLPGSRRFCARGRAHSGCLRLGRATVESSPRFNSPRPATAGAAHYLIHLSRNSAGGFLAQKTMSPSEVGAKPTG
jgi:hypothetical protein